MQTVSRPLYQVGAVRVQTPRVLRSAWTCCRPCACSQRRPSCCTSKPTCCLAAPATLRACSLRGATACLAKGPGADNAAAADDVDPATTTTTTTQAASSSAQQWSVTDVLLVLAAFCVAVFVGMAGISFVLHVPGAEYTKVELAGYATAAVVSSVFTLWGAMQLFYQNHSIQQQQEVQAQKMDVQAKEVRVEVTKMGVEVEKMGVQVRKDVQEQLQNYQLQNQQALQAGINELDKKLVQLLDDRPTS